jgi:cell division protein FtsI (penicillin-binding protein 3)
MSVSETGDMSSDEAAADVQSKQSEQPERPARPARQAQCPDGPILPVGTLTSLDAIQQTSDRRVLRAGWVFVGLISLVMLALLGRVAQLQIHPPEPIAPMVNSQNSSVPLLPRRGSIVDRHGRPLGGTLLAKRLFVDPQLIKDPNTFSERVGYGLDYNPAQVERTISARVDSRFVVIDQAMSPEQAAKLDDLKLAALGVQLHSVRDYPMGHLAGQIIGFVGVDNHGLDGLEQSLDKTLSGRPGHLAYWRDAQRNPIWIDQQQYQPATDGRTVRLTLDAEIQSIAETQLKAAVDQFHADSGQMIVMQPRTGQILAMANDPFFDPENYRTAKAELRRNRCVTDTFEPGSTFKPFIWAAATQQGVAHLGEKFDTTTAGVFVLPYGRRLHDAHPNGVITWEQVLISSSNIGMAKAAMRMTPQELYNAVTAFGFGQKPGSDLPGESPGMVHPLSKWTSYSMSSIPMGQEIAVTPLQLARGFCAIANGGLLVTPRIICPPADAPLPVGVRVISAQTAQTTKNVMHRVVTEGTGQHAESHYYSMFGKTGTAEVSVPGKGYGSGVYTANFMAGAPLDNPQIVVLCVIHKPDPKIGHYGGTVAAPAVRNVIDQTLAYLGIAPDMPGHDEHANHRPRLAQRD